MEEGCGVVTLNRTCPANATPPILPDVHQTGLEVVVELYLISALCLVGLFGNAVTVIVLRKDKERREALLLLQALALADGGYLLVALLRYPLKYLLPQYDYWRMQPTVFPLLKVFQTVCIWMMVLVTIDRYIYVCKPLRAQVLFNCRTRRWMAVAVFMVGVLYNVMCFVDSCILQFYDPCTNHTLTRMVTRKVFNNHWYYDVYKHGCFLTLIYFLPLSILTVLNCLLIRAIKHSTRRHRNITTSGDYNENNATIVLIIIVLVFIGCETPELLLRVFNIIERKANIELFGAGLMRFMTISELLMVINSSVNFFIYFAFGRRFRKVMRETFVVRFTTSGTVLTPESVPLHRQPINIARINHMLHNHVNTVKTHVSPAKRLNVNHVMGNHGNNISKQNGNVDRMDACPNHVAGSDVKCTGNDVRGAAGNEDTNENSDADNCNQLNHG